MAFDGEAFEETGFWTKIVEAVTKFTGKILQRNIRIRQRRKMTISIKLRESDINIKPRLRE